MQIIATEKKWLSVKEVKGLYGVGRTTIYKWRRDHLVKWSTIGRKVYIMASSIDQLLDSNSSEFQFTKLKNE